MRVGAIIVAGGLLAAHAFEAAAAEPVMVRCGRDYQAARSAGTLDGTDWNSFRVACAERLKGETPPPAAGAAPPPPALVPASGAGATAPAAPPPGPVPPAAASEGLSPMHARQKQCGAEWRAGKASLVAQRPGLSWPRYWSECNARLKAAGG